MKERKFKLITGCKTRGFTDLSMGNTCGDPECNPCSSFNKAFKEEVDRLSSLWDINAPGITGNVLVDPEFDEFKTPYTKLTREHIKQVVESVFNKY